MTTDIDRLKSALADRYTIEREIGSGGMARRAVRRYGSNRGRMAEIGVGR
jgi:hypothetical protein